jgi:large subunit ribosomal protein L24
MKKETKLKTHVKIGDRVKIIAGNQKGLLGNITALDKKKSAALIDSIVLKKKKNKNQEKDTNIEQYIHTSNLMIVDSTTNTCSRIGRKLVENKKLRYFKKSGNFLTN